MLNPPVPMLLKSCPVALLSEILTVILAPIPSCAPTLKTTCCVLPTSNGRAIPVPGGVGFTCVFLSTNGAAATSKYGKPVNCVPATGVPCVLPSPSWYATTTCSLSFQPNIIEPLLSLFKESASVTGLVRATFVSPAVAPNVVVLLNSTTSVTVVLVAFIVIEFVVNDVPFQSLR